MNKRRYLSGIYIFDKFPEDEQRLPTCIEDCQLETRVRWLNTLEKEALIDCINSLCDTITKMSDKFGIIAK
jgi:hypothetical protein